MAFKGKSVQTDKVKPLTMGGMISLHAGRLMFKSVEMGETDEQHSVIGWGRGVEVLDSAMSPFLMSDEKYKIFKKKILKLINSINIHTNSPKAKEDYFKAYNMWFMVLCRRMTKIGLYPDSRAEISDVSGLTLIDHEEPRIDSIDDLNLKGE
jgi:hypothetical protein